MVRAVLCALLLAGSAGAPVDTLEGLGRALTACWTAPPGSAGSDLTVLVSLKRDGSINGRPRITHAKLLGTTAQREAFATAALEAVARCTPVAISPALGGAIAGRVFTIRFVGGGPAVPV